MSYRVQDDFDTIMLDAFPGGIPTPTDAIIAGGDHTVYHYVEALVQVYDMLSCYADLNERVDADVPGWAVVQEHAGKFLDALALIEPESDAAVTVWLREAGAVASVALADWLGARRIPQVFLWVHGIGHGFIPFVVQGRVNAEAMIGGVARSRLVKPC